MCAQIKMLGIKCSLCLSTHILTFVSGPRMLLQRGNLEASFNLKEGKRRVMEKKIILMAVRGDSYSARLALKVPSSMVLTSSIDIFKPFSVLFLFIFILFFKNHWSQNSALCHVCNQEATNRN